MQHSESIAALVKAVIAAKQEIQPVKRTAVNPFYKSTYASFQDVVESVEPALLKNGLTFFQGTVDEDDAGFTMETQLCHESGEWIIGRMRIPMEKPTAQGAGSANSYSRRYGLSALLGVVTEEDDDGNEAEKHSKPEQAKRDAVNGPLVRPAIPAVQSHSVPSTAYEPPPMRKPASRPQATLVGVEGLAKRKPDSFGGDVLKPLVEWQERNLAAARDYYQGVSTNPEKARYRMEALSNAALLIDEIERRELSVEPASLLGGPEPWDER